MEGVSISDPLLCKKALDLNKTLHKNAKLSDFFYAANDFVKSFLKIVP